MADVVQPTPRRRRLSREDRREQLVGIGLRLFVERPAAEVALEHVAAAAGVSSGLIYHYFPTRTQFHQAVVAAATRRVLTGLHPPAGLTGEAALTEIVERFVTQIARRRDSYLALVYGQVLQEDAPEGALAGTLRAGIARLVAQVAGIPGEGTTGQPSPGYARVHAWVAYVEDMALQWSDPDPANPTAAVARLPLAAVVEHLVAMCRAALAAPAWPSPAPSEPAPGTAGGPATGP